jgi:hypothetical protein|tara:strand:+ start:10051 stop:10167 length:117 start_codon:yes stop_codon:yes gene_type:complete
MKFFKEHPLFNEVCEEKTNKLFGDKKLMKSIRNHKILK